MKRKDIKTLPLCGVLKILLLELKFIQNYKSDFIITYVYETPCQIRIYINYIKSQSNYTINILDEYGRFLNVNEWDKCLDFNQVIKFIKSREEFVSYFRKEKITKLLFQSNENTN